MATKTVSCPIKSHPDDPDGFMLCESRRPNYDPVKDGYKLKWNKLNRADGTPMTSPGWVLRRFSELEKAGWEIINREEFKKRHFPSAR